MTGCFESRSPEETYSLGKKLAQAAEPGELYALMGDLGSGKTVFTKGFAAGIGVREEVVSPTFTILQIYESGRLPLYHFDVYRIGDIGEMEEIGWDDYAYGEGVCLVEWAENIEELIFELPPEKFTLVTIQKDLEMGLDFRRILLEKREGT
jgi:tRNA threonylcarbamoyladenosine biosynthesis protein TsaE